MSGVKQQETKTEAKEENDLVSNVWKGVLVPVGGDGFRGG